MTERELLDKIDNLLRDFRELSETRRYLALKKAVEEDRRLALLLEESRALQKKARLLPTPNKEAMLEKAKSLYREYEEDPLVVNLRSCKEELLDLLRPLSDFRL